MLCIAARQREKATTSVSELVQAVKRPRALSESANRPFIRKSGSANEEEEEEEKAENLLRRNSESVASFRRKSHGGTRSSMQRISELPEKKQKNSHRRSLMGYILLYILLHTHKYILMLCTITA